MMPPASGPTTAEVAQTVAIAPCTRPRSSSLKRSPMIVIVTGWMAPAPSPCSSRNSTSDIIDQAKPQSAEPTRKMIMPAISTGLRPKISESLP